jgi:hypothetical protein
MPRRQKIYRFCLKMEVYITALSFYPSDSTPSMYPSDSDPSDTTPSTPPPLSHTPPTQPPLIRPPLVLSPSAGYTAPIRLPIG